jgi:hypothetical protein
MFQESPEAPTPSEPTCGACDGSAGRPYWGVIWGEPLCEACARAWHADAAVLSASALPHTADTKTAYEAATRAFIAARRRVKP